MIGGIVVDLLVIGAVLAFAWGGTILGGLSTLGRLSEAVVAVTVAALLRDPVGSLVQSLLGASDDFSRLVGMLLVGLATWICVQMLFRYWVARRAAGRIDPEDDYALDGGDPLDSPRVARLAGGVLGLGWALLFLSVIVLQPRDTVVSRSAIQSRIGGMVIHQQSVLEWLRDGFPHYTQTLPKGKLGAVVGERDDLPMRDPVEAEARGNDADTLLRSINDLRRNADSRVLAFNPDIAAIARRQAVSMAEQTRLTYRSAGGGSLDSRVLSALGESAGEFGEDVGIEVVWAHDPATAMRGLLDSTRAQSLLKEPRWSEVGIGVADAGWFNGRIYVILLVGASTSAAEAADDAALEDGAAGAEAAIGGEPDVDPSGSDSSDDSTTDDGFDDSSSSDDDLGTFDECEAFDVDGDGVPDAESIDPEICPGGPTNPVG